jgi:hypothetical protein
MSLYQTVGTNSTREITQEQGPFMGCWETYIPLMYMLWHRFYFLSSLSLLVFWIVLKFEKWIRYSLCAYCNLRNSGAIFRYFELYEFIGVLCRCHEKIGIYVGCMFGAGSCWNMCVLGNSHIEHLVARTLPKFVFLAQSWTYQLALFLEVVLLQSLGATHSSTFIVP